MVFALINDVNRHLFDVVCFGGTAADLQAPISVGKTKRFPTMCVQVVPALLMYPLSILLIFKRVHGLCNQHPPFRSSASSLLRLAETLEVSYCWQTLSRHGRWLEARKLYPTAVQDISIHSRLINDATRYPYCLESNTEQRCGTVVTRELTLRSHCGALNPTTQRRNWCANCTDKHIYVYTRCSVLFKILNKYYSLTHILIYIFIILLMKTFFYGKLCVISKFYLRCYNYFSTLIV